MKKTVKMHPGSLIALGLVLIIFSGCKKDEETTPTPEPTPAPLTVTDVDGNLYHTITIGTQIWMLENLKVTHYRNGDPIPHVTDPTQWYNLTSGAYVNYDNSGANGDTYGRLYNWYAVADGPFLAPAGWHIPSKTEWQILIDYLGGEDVAGMKLKESGTTHWLAPNDSSTNESGFSAFPGGYYGGGFAEINVSAYYWTTTEMLANEALLIYMGYGHAGTSYVTWYKRLGFSVRCIKDK
jgi:uncharacterized protein (TIGR02145 family)